MSEDNLRIVAKIQKALADIGTGSTGCPKSTNNTEAYAWEFLVASIGKSYFTKRYDVAKANCSEVGVIDPDDNTNTAMYDGEHVMVTQTVSKPAQRINAKALIVELTRQGVSKTVLDDCVKKATVFNAPAKKLTVLAR